VAAKRQSERKKRFSAEDEYIGLKDPDYLEERYVNERVGVLFYLSLHSLHSCDVIYYWIYFGIVCLLSVILC